MSTTVYAKRNDVGYIFIGTLSLTNAVDWTDATVRFLLRKGSSGRQVSGVGSITGYGTGSVSSSDTAAVEYVSDADDLKRDGVYDQEWEVTYSSGAVITFPSRGWNRIVVGEDLG